MVDFCGVSLFLLFELLLIIMVFFIEWLVVCIFVGGRWGICGRGIGDVEIRVVCFMFVFVGFCIWFGFLIFGGIFGGGILGRGIGDDECIGLEEIFVSCFGMDVLSEVFWEFYRYKLV